MKHVIALSHLKRVPGKADSLERNAKVISEALELAGELADTLTNWNDLVDQKAAG